MRGAFLRKENEMNAKISWNEDSKTINCDGTESDLFKQVGQVLLDIEVPNALDVEFDGRKASFDVQKRGTFMKKGEKRPSMYVTCNYNHISGLKKSKYPEKYLKCVNLEGNNYKFYHLLPIGDAYTTGVDAEYGSIDTDTCAPRHLKEPYEPFLYWIRYYEKLSKGYEDHTKFQLEKSKTVQKKKEDKSANGILYRELMAYANHIVKESLQDSRNITQAQVKEARKEFNRLLEVKTYRGFNNHLQRLIGLSPRNIGNRAMGHASHMSELLPKDFSWQKDKAKKAALEKEEMERIISREETLLLAMEAVVGLPNTKSDESKYDSFKQYDIDVFEANDTQKKEVMSFLTPRLQAKVDKIYRVKPHAQEKKMREYCKKNSIRAIKKFWHGSVNANWASIIQNSLQMKPAANGRMFGDGHYFAPSADKSFNYTSYRGTTWAHGSDDTGFMGLYAVAYGNPWMVRSSGRYTQDQLKRGGYNCVHAAAVNTGLRADEVIVYSDAAICLNYIVKFK